MDKASNRMVANKVGNKANKNNSMMQVRASAVVPL